MTQQSRTNMDEEKEKLEKINEALKKLCELIENNAHISEEAWMSVMNYYVVKFLKSKECTYKDYKNVLKYLKKQFKYLWD